jgi:hypothetical protein
MVLAAASANIDSLNELNDTGLGTATLQFHLALIEALHKKAGGYRSQIGAPKEEISASGEH